MSYQRIAGIQHLVAKHYGISVAEMISPRRKRSIARPRQVAMYLCWVEAGYSYPVIGWHFGRRDHTTVMHAVRTVLSIKSVNAEFDHDIKYLRAALRAAA